MTKQTTVGDLRDFIEDVDDDCPVYFRGSGAIMDCVGGTVTELEWNNGDTEKVFVLGEYGTGLPPIGGSE